MFDVHMMSELNGQESTEEEFAHLFSNSGWIFIKTCHQPNSSMAVLGVLRSKRTRSNRYGSYGWNWRKIADIYGDSSTTVRRWFICK